MRQLALLCLGALLLAGSVDAAPAPQVFRLTIRAVAVADFDHTGAPVESNGCTNSSRAEGFLTARYGSRRSVLVRFVAGRLQSVTAGPIDGTLRLAGTNEVDEVCAATETHSPQYCARTARTFRNGKLTLRAAGTGRLTIRPGPIALRAIDCPREPDQLRRAPLGPPSTTIRIAPSVLASTRTNRITIGASARRTLTYGHPESGFLQQRTTWKLTLTRVRP